MHGKMVDDKSASEIDIPPDLMHQIIPGLERLVLENRLHVDAAQAIITTHKVPLEIGHHLGLMAHTSTIQQQQNFSHSASPLNTNYPSMNDHMTNMHHFQGININFSCTGNYRSPETVGSPLNSSPMHQITRGISGLTTGTTTSHEPLDLTMESASVGETMDGQWNMQSSNFYDARPLNLTSSVQSQVQTTPTQRIIAPTPPTSPSNNLCIIQEEHLPTSSQYCLSATSFDITAQHLHHPQICLTDVQGSEITLVALSDSSRDSDDSLDTTDTSRRTASTVTTPGNASGSRGISMFHEFLIKEPSDDMPSITRGVGRKASLENENKHVTCVIPTSVKIETDPYARRGSDKSLGFSDDSLSNDSNQSPAQEVSHSSGFKSTEEERLSPDSLSESRIVSSADEYYELPLPNECRNLDVPSIMEIVRQQIINSKIPPKGFTINRSESDQHAIVDHDASNMNVEYSSGLQIELKICERHVSNGGPERAGTSSMDHPHHHASKGIIKLRRISGDQNEYGKLCQQLLTSLTV
jgi:serine/threonine-protein kinase SIK3